MLDGSFVRGTTPTLVLPLPEDLKKSELYDFTIAFQQKNKTVLVKRKEDTIEVQGLDPEKNIVLSLKQEETSMFNPNIKVVGVQLKVITINREIFVLGDYRLRLENSYDEEWFDFGEEE